MARQIVQVRRLSRETIGITIPKVLTSKLGMEAGDRVMIEDISPTKLLITREVAIRDEDRQEQS